MGRVQTRAAATICRVASASTAPTPREPIAPAFDTKAAISGEDTPANGTLTIGNSIPSLRLTGKKVADGRRNLRGVCLQREMAGIEEAHDRVRDVTLERLGPWR
jgi:hypothetical protein